MPQSAVEQYRRWFEYERDAHAKMLASLDTVPADRRAGAEYRKAVALIGHLAGARRIWLYRLGGAPAPPAALFPENSELPAAVADLHDVQDRWAGYYGRLTDAELDRVFEYRSWDGGTFRNRVEDVLTQLFGHSSYHRGQIASLVKAAGGEPAITDFVFWCREPGTRPEAGR